MRLLVVAGLLAGPTALAFDSGGFFDRGRHVAGIAAWALVALLAVLGGRLPRSRAALAAIGGLAALAAWSALSVTWAPLEEPARGDVGRLVLYLGAFTASALAWTDRRHARLAEPVLAGGALVVTGYGLAGRLLPDLVELDRSATAAGRLEQPLTYWNSMGALAAFGLALAVRVAGDRSRCGPVRTAAAAAAPALGMGVYLSFSRGAIAALLAGVAVVLVIRPTHSQIRAALVAIAAGVLAAVVASLLPGVESLTGDSPARDGAIALTALVLLAAGAAAAQRTWVARGDPAGELRIPGRVPAVAAVAVGVVAVALVAAALDRGAVDPERGATPARLADAGSNRYAYWKVALGAFADDPLRGSGTAGFRVDWLREREIDETVRDAHSLYIETAAELGIPGLVLLGLFLGGVAAAARRAVAADRALAAGWAGGVVVVAVHSGLDWHWEMPAVALPALVLAGALVARGCVRTPAASAD